MCICYVIAHYLYLWERNEYIFINKEACLSSIRPYMQYYRTIDTRLCLPQSKSISVSISGLNNCTDEKKWFELSMPLPVCYHDVLSSHIWIVLNTLHGIVFLKSKNATKTPAIFRVTSIWKKNYYIRKLMTVRTYT